MYYLYRITNGINSKMYIGQTINPKSRWYNHRRSAAEPRQVVSYAMKKYGTHNFTFDIIAQCLTLDDANDIEKVLIKQSNSMVPNGYNVEPGGKNKILSEETKTKISKTLMGHPAKANSGSFKKGNTPWFVGTNKHPNKIGINQYTKKEF